MTKAVDKPDKNRLRREELDAEIQDFLRAVGTPGVFKVLDLRVEIVNGELQRNRISLSRTGV